MHQIKQKHPHNKDAHPEVLLPDIPEEIHYVKFHSIDAESVKKVILKTKGAAGPSGLDADGWKRILITNQFGNSSTIYVNIGRGHKEALYNRRSIFIVRGIASV